MRAERNRDGGGAVPASPTLRGPQVRSPDVRVDSSRRHGGHRNGRHGGYERPRHRGRHGHHGRHYRGYCPFHRTFHFPLLGYPYVDYVYDPYDYRPYGPRIHVSVGGGGGSSGSRDRLGALDLDVSPERAEVYLDGEYIGTADDFDGFPAYLWVEEGTYELSFYLEGYETLTREYSIYPGVVIDVEDKLRRGVSVRPEPPLAGPGSYYSAEEPLSEPTPPAADEVGRLHLSVWPEDAAVYVDGHFLGTGAEISQLSAGLVVAPGPHAVEVLRPGYESAFRELEIAADEDLELVLDLVPSE